MRSAPVVAVLGLLSAIVASKESAVSPLAANRLTPPPDGPIPVAFLISDGATMIDFAGPWEVFQDVVVSGREAFHLYTVARSKEPIRTSGGMTVVPDYTVASAPPPKVVVIPAQSAASVEVQDWLRKSAETADVVMSVCAGSFILASTGLLDGHPATTHHAFYHRFEAEYPKVAVQRGKRFVEGPRLATAGGLTSGIDLALRVVERYFGTDAADRTAYYMEYQSEGWRDPTGASNATYLKPRLTSGMAVCPVCEMEVPEGQVTHEYSGRTYHLCSSDCRARFVADPEKYLPAGNETP